MNTDDKKKKQKPYSEFEKQLLMQLVTTKMDIVENRKTDGETNDDDGVYWQNKKNRMIDMEVHVLGEEPEIAIAVCECDKKRLLPSS
ncbi:unnamed protein product [Arctia plantaginis]|uniref:Uncharacterized protein n=1 Tax=Arctia plantaginis TaxID=874455 RepID=A0A8S1ARJ4_ARCPL|nr:unnamed protein product [Arctia plantaginis]